ncbi:MAG: hypothetical protein Q8904_00150 [Bacteroidota bacterium]|nr:hypothetical protein [Bacteroidota bacterium]
MKTVYKLLILLLPLYILSSCQKDTYEPSLAVGLWKQVSVTEDGVPMTLTPEQGTCKLLIDGNGAYRCYHQSFKSYNSGNGPTSFYGTWSMLDGKWINFTTDKWELIATLTTDSDKVVLAHKRVAIAPKDTITVIDTLKSVQKQWAQYHIQSRFTILQLSKTEMEIRLKTFVGEKKYALLFAPAPVDFIELIPAPAGKPIYIPKLVTDDNYWIIRNELQTLKTYVFKFKKESY